MDPKHVPQAVDLMKRRERLLEGLKRIRDAPNYNGILEIKIGGFNVLSIWREGCGPNPPKQESPDRDLLYLLEHVREAFERKLELIDAELRRIGIEIKSHKHKKNKKKKR